MYPGIFPEAEKDPVIQIANMVKIQGQKEPFIRNVFTLNTCSAIVGAEVRSHQKEGDMLEVRGDNGGIPEMESINSCGNTLKETIFFKLYDI